MAGACVLYFVLLLPFIASCACPRKEAYLAALKEIDWNALKEDIIQFLTTSQSFWPADFGHYGPFMVRQAWHCTGSYRTSDGLGGCDGGRQRFDPERSWDDNTNLDKAKKLLLPIKLKYGLGLSWGDLIVFTANTAIEIMGGPVFGFCAGRIDDYDGSDSILLGPTPEQAAKYPCAVNGQCVLPFGTTTIGLIYVNPEGPMGQPIPSASAPQIRDVFGRMSMNDMETAALIGGGHAFGKTHGACPLGAGPSPKEDPSNPWPGLCGTGRGKDTFTSGFEGPWSPTPTKWSNSYFTALLNYNWNVTIGPGGHHQWETVNGGPSNIMMLTTDISLRYDTSYLNYVKLFAGNISELNEAFSKAWYKLTTRDMGPVSRCVGPFVPQAQPFQYPLPPPPAVLPDWNEVKTMIEAVMFTNNSILPPDPAAGPYYGALFIHAAWQCSSTFRGSDYIGGCNGARIRFPPQATYPANAGVDKILQILAPVKAQFGDSLTWADLIVFAGTVALSDSTNSDSFAFCGGRSDATDGTGSLFLQPNGDFTADMYNVLKFQLRFSDREIIALMGRPRSPSQLFRMGYYGTWSTNLFSLTNEYYTTLLTENWQNFTVPGSEKLEYKAQGKEVYITSADINLLWDATTLAIVEDFASDNDMFLAEFTKAWTKLMNVDRFDGPVKNVCDSKSNNFVLRQTN